jgi:hypothetical protein
MPTLEGIMGQPCRWANGDAKAALAGGLWAVVLVALNRMVRHPSDPQKLPAALQAGRVPHSPFTLESRWHWLRHDVCRKRSSRQTSGI